MFLLGIDVGTSSIKVSVVDVETGKCVAAASSPSHPQPEREVIAIKHGWAEQDPEQWWDDAKLAIQKLNSSGSYNPADIAAIGIAYQMHGLVLVDKDLKPLRHSIIWCDSRAVPFGDAAFEAIGKDRSLQHLLNSPGNFTAAKLAWVKKNEPEVYEKIYKIMLPGDYIALKLTGETSTSISSLSEGIFWDFKENRLATDVFNFWGFDEAIIPEIKNVFSVHGGLTASMAQELGFKQGIPVSYKAGDQPNNALSLNVLKPGEVAATAGTSGVIYAVTDQLFYDNESRVNSFAHVNHTTEQQRIGVLLCINGTGIMNRWVRNVAGSGLGYDELNNIAAGVPTGSDGLLCFPFGNGAERMLNNRLLNAHFCNLDLNAHNEKHMLRAAQEGIAFSFRYGLDIMRENGLTPSLVKAGNANMFLSPVFRQSFVNSTGLTVQLYDTDGSVGAALGAGIGAGIYASPEEAFANVACLKTIAPDSSAEQADICYQNWKEQLLKLL